jgi:curli biogenesis system outer membrane secretion channel CsgG
MRNTLLALLLAASLSCAQSRKALSIDDFDYSAVMTSVQAIFGNQQNIGQGINAMMTRRIAQDGRFMVVERRKVNNVMREQDFDARSDVHRLSQGQGDQGSQHR